MPAGGKPCPTGAWLKLIIASGLPSGTKLTAYVLALHADSAGEVRCARKVLAKAAGQHEHTIGNHLRYLRRAHLLSRIGPERFQFLRPAKDGGR